jgi:hypothetical protein
VDSLRQVSKNHTDSGSCAENINEIHSNLSGLL